MGAQAANGPTGLAAHGSLASAGPLVPAHTEPAVTLIAYATVNRSHIVQATPVDFNGSATGGTPPYAYKWFFGDGHNWSSRNVSYTYLTPGLYQSVLDVMDSRGAIAFASVTVNVTQGYAGTSVVASASVSSGLPPLTVSFTSNASGALSQLTYTWAFGDGANGSGMSPTHSYSGGGVFGAQVSVDDIFGDHASYIVTIFVHPNPLVVTARAVPTSGPAPLSVNFSVQVGGGWAPYQYFWGLGAFGATSNLPDPTFVYNRSGNFRVNLTVTDGISEGASKTLFVAVAPPAPL
ncbi:MAG TPA: PKD domain-containing protein, partial [Thermoplasmata archaeon]|nr:PKD domain-containing protein [Thermoplasmata archaeon]